MPPLVRGYKMLPNMLPERKERHVTEIYRSIKRVSRTPNKNCMKPHAHVAKHYENAFHQHDEPDLSGLLEVTHQHRCRE